MNICHLFFRRAAEPHPTGNDIHHEAHEDHEAKNIFPKINPLRFPIFVPFATFVVRKPFVEYPSFN
jgi:hypothetical protein